MPTFIDWHASEGLPEDMRTQLRERVRRGERDEHGVVDRGIVMDREAGRMYCILEAPDREAVRRHHEAAGVPLETLHEADAIL